jgi:predicted glycogen debranching enzyme
MMRFGVETLSIFSRGIEKEWIVTNGLGGFASSTVVGANTRRYHGLLIAAIRPPIDRRLFLAKLDEEIMIEGTRQIYKLGSNKYTGAIHPEGHQHLIEFRMDVFPSYIYKIEGILIEKRILMPHGENTTIIAYHVIRSDRAFSLKAIPLINARDYHHIMREAPWPFEQRVTSDPAGSEVKVEAYPGAPLLTMWGAGASYSMTGIWYKSMEYLVEKRRGLDYIEDHYNPGFFKRRLEQGDTYIVIATIENVYERNIALLIRREEERREELLGKAGLEEPLARRLTIAADQFIVLRKSTGTRTIIAGYPWFTDWGRDTMISIPGLTLVTKRYDDAREILWTFAKFSEKGLIPNKFPDAGERPEYNTADAPLWFFYAVYKYLQYTRDFGFVMRNLYPVMAEIILHYRRGTFFNIGMDKDFLIRAGDHGTQLTWMDAKVGDCVITPRDGKAVEIPCSGLKI